MKFIYALFMLATLSALAGESFECTESKPYGPGDSSIKLTQVGNARIREGIRYPFKLEFFAKGKKVSTQRVTVVTEDVMYEFSNKSIRGRIYADELDVAIMWIKGKKVNLDCSEEER